MRVSGIVVGRGVSFVAAAVVAGVVVASGGARHVPGGLYTGTHSGGDALEFQVSADGKAITRFELTQVPIPVSGGTCYITRETASELGKGIPINNHAFSYRATRGTETVSFSGSFPSPQRATGSLELDEGTTFICGDRLLITSGRWTSGTLTWTAAAGGPSGPTPPSAPIAPHTPSFLGGHTHVKLLRGKPTKRDVSVLAQFRMCAGTRGPFRLFVTQRRKAGGVIAAQGRFSRELVGGRPVSSPVNARCRDHSVTWRLADKFFGPGWLIVILRVDDAAGNQSGSPSWAFRAPRH